MSEIGKALTNSERDWESANEFFRSSLHHNNEILDIDNEINLMKSTLCNYFSQHHGVVNDGKKDNFETDYSAMSKNELKRQLKVLKSRIPNPEEKIKHVSHILREKFWKKGENYDH